MSRTTERWRKRNPRHGKRGQQERLSEREVLITPPALPSTMRMKSLILDEELVVEGDITVGGDDPSDNVSDGLPPSASPTPTVTGGQRWLAVKWDSSVNNDLVTYEVHVGTSAAFATGPTTLAAEVPGNLVFIRTVNGSPLLYATNYYVKLIAKDVDGVAPVGGEVGPTVLDPNKVDDYTAGSITADKFNAVMALVSALIAGTTSAERIEVGYGTDGAGNLDSNFIGVRCYESDGVTLTFLVDAETGDVYVRGLIDWGTNSKLLNTDIMEIYRQDPPVLGATTYMTPANVQSNKNQGSGSATASSTWGSATTAGNLLIALVVVDDNRTVTTPAGWALVQSKAHADGEMRSYLFSYENAPKKTGTQNFTLSGNGEWAVCMAEYSGVENAAAAQDQLATASSGNGTAPATGTTGTTTLANELLIAAFGGYDTIPSDFDLDWTSPTNSFTIRKQANVNVGGVSGPWEDSRAVLLDRVVSATGTYSTALTDSSGGDYNGHIVTFKAKAITPTAPYPDSPGVGSGVVRVYSKQDMHDAIKLATRSEDTVETFLDPLNNMRNRFSHFTDFLTVGGSAAAGTSAILDSNLYADTIGAGSTVGGNAGEASHPGILDTTPGTTTTGFAVIRGRGSGIALATGDRIRTVCWIKTNATNLSDGTNRYRLYSGFMSDPTSPSAAATKGAWVWYSDSGVATGGANNTWNLYMSNGTTLAADPLDDNGGAITVAINTWYRIDMEWVVDTGVSVWINGIKKVTNYNTNSPVAGDTLTWVPIATLKALGTTSRANFIDAAGIDYIFATQR